MKLELLSGGSNAGEDSNIKRGVKKSEMGTDQEAPIRRPLKKMSWGGQKGGAALLCSCAVPANLFTCNVIISKQ